MTPEIAYSDGMATLWHGHVIDTLRTLEAESVQMCVTSPPYFGLRAYGTDPVVWGGDSECQHAFVRELLKPQSGGTGDASKKQVTNAGSQESQRQIQRGECVNCGAWYGEYGHEPSPARYIENTMLILDEIWRVLRKDGVVFWNVADSYAGSGKGPSKSLNKANSYSQGINSGVVPNGVKPKDLMLIPERFAIAAQERGWYVRSRIAWVKNNPMPESVRDRPTSAWEHIWMLTKSREYFWNAEGAKEPATSLPKDWVHIPQSKEFNTGERMDGGIAVTGNAQTSKGLHRQKGGVYGPGGTRNIRNAWVLNQRSFKGAHFATFNPEIPKRCIEIASKAGDVVLDPFAGSATTNYVATQLGRKSIGIELQRQYIDDVAIPRLNPFRRKDEGAA